MRRLHCIWVLALVLATVPAAGQESPDRRARGYTIFVEGTAVGVENILVEVTADELIITSQGRLDPPANVDLRFAEIRYSADGSPIRLSMESMVDGSPALLETQFENGFARSSGIQGDMDIDRSDPVSPNALVLSSGFFGAYEAVTRRLAGAVVGTELRAYIAPEAEVVIRLESIGAESVQTPSSTIALRRYDVVIIDPVSEVSMSLSAEPTGELARITVPDQGLEVIRNDIASPTLVTSEPRFKPPASASVQR
jgi:hypothetical protein